MSGVVVRPFIVRAMTMAELFYIIGGSGAGKDSLIQYVQEHIHENIPVNFVRRYITRAADAGGEHHIAITPAEYSSMEAQGRFAMSWFSHDTYYGISNEIDHWMSSGIGVVMNGSRGYLRQAAEKYPDIVPVLISVEPDILCERLFARGRESYKQIEKRIAQAISLERTVAHPRLLRIENNNALEEAGEALLNIITKKTCNQCA